MGSPVRPLLTLDAIADLAGYLPEDSIDTTAVRCPRSPHQGRWRASICLPARSPRGIESNQVLDGPKRIEQHPDYSGLLNAVLDDVTPLAEGQRGRGDPPRGLRLPLLR